MANKKKTRKEFLKGPDEFITFSGKIVSFFTAHLRQLQYIGVGVGVIIIAYIAIYIYMGSVNKKGQNAYNEAYYFLINNLQKDEDYKNLPKSEELFKKVIENYGLAKASRLALPQIAYLKFTDKKYDEAIEYYQKFLTKISGNKPYESLTSFALASCYEAKGDLAKAIEILNPLMEANNNPFKEQVMFSLARLYRLDNKLEKTEEILKKFVIEFKDSPFLPMAKAGLS